MRDGGGSPGPRRRPCRSPRVTRSGSAGSGRRRADVPRPAAPRPASKRQALAVVERLSASPKSGGRGDAPHHDQGRGGPGSTATASSSCRPAARSGRGSSSRPRPASPPPAPRPRPRCAVPPSSLLAPRATVARATHAGLSHRRERRIHGQVRGILGIEQRQLVPASRTCSACQLLRWCGSGRGRGSRPGAPGRVAGRCAPTVLGYRMRGGPSPSRTVFATTDAHCDRVDQRVAVHDRRVRPDLLGSPRSGSRRPGRDHGPEPGDPRRIARCVAW